MKYRNTSLFYLAWIVSIVATLGSLYFSEVRGFIPCEMCWYQRILMYPLTLILGIAIFRSEYQMKWYVLPISIIGIVTASIHYMEQKIPGFGWVKPCAQGVPCNIEYINYMGFITIPFLSLTAFIIITVLLLFVKKSNIK